MLPFCIKDPKPAMWKVGGIKIESAAGRRIFYQIEMEIREKHLENEERFCDGLYKAVYILCIT